LLRLVKRLEKLNYRRIAYSAVAVMAIVLGGSAFLASRTNIGQGATAASTEPTVTAKPTALEPTSGFYLDIGASASLGMQPNGILGRNGHNTNTGYSNDLVAIEAAKGVSLVLHQVGCPGETAQSMAGKIHDHCYHAPATQMSTAISYLRVNHSEVGVVTIDLGFNNVRPCLTVVPVDVSCASRGIALVRQNMPKVLNELKSAAGPNVHFVGIEYGDPWLAHYLKASAGPSDATQTLVEVGLLNQALGAAFSAAGVPVANVPKAFQSNSTNRVALPGVGTVPENVAKICEFTWMCKTPPWGPDDHPNNAGYMVIAQTISAVLPSTW
jgi:hypothetical protein